MVAELGFNQAADLALLELCDSVFNRRHERALLDHAQVAAQFSRTRILRLRFRDRRETGWIGAHFSEDRFGLLLCGCLVGGRGALWCVDQDVARGAALRRAVTRLVLGEEIGDFSVADGDLAFDGFRVEHHVFDARLLGHGEQCGVLVVVGLDHFVGDFDLADEVRNREYQLLHFAFLVVHLRQALGDGARHEGAALYGVAQLLQRHVAAHARVEHRWRHALRGQHGLVLFHVEAAVRLLEGVDAGDGLGQRGVADGQVAAFDFRFQRALCDQVVKDCLACFRRIEQLLVELVAHLLAIAVDLLALRFFPFLLGDLAAVDVCDAHGGVTALIAADADQYERRDDQQHQEDLHQAFVSADKFKHGSATSKLS